MFVRLGSCVEAVPTAAKSDLLGNCSGAVPIAAMFDQAEIAHSSAAAGPRAAKSGQEGIGVTGPRWASWSQLLY